MNKITSNNANKPGPLALIILDGWGQRADAAHNALLDAKTPFIDHLLKTYPHTLLNASQQHVGLPAGTIGNSEIGHMTMGAGRVINTDLVRISKAMRLNEFKTNPAFAGLFRHIKKYNSTLHILGLISPSGVHSHQDHLHGLLRAAKEAGLEKVAIHAFTDGRDAPPQSAAKYLKELENVIKDLGIGYIATASGRYYALDRDNNWQRTDRAVRALFESFGTPHYARNPSQVLEELYGAGTLDEYLEPVIFFDNNGKSYPIEQNDGVLFFNFRTDRPRQLSARIVEKAKGKNLYFVTMTQYHPSIESHVAFPPLNTGTTLGAEISKAGLKQAHIAETEKYGHVTFFFNGGRQDPYPNERQILIDSRKDVKTHDLAPQMRAREIADKALEVLDEGTDFTLINFANADIVGHTANMPAIIKAAETIDAQLKRIVEKVLSISGFVIITADHGNAELNVDASTGEKHTAHTTNPVPFILVSPRAVIPSESDEPRNRLNSNDNGSPSAALRAWPNTQPFQVGLPEEALAESGRDGTREINLKSSGSLADIAPTILQLMNLKKPASMTGKSLIS